jgi:hypothetical protein
VSTPLHRPVGWLRVLLWVWLRLRLLLLGSGVHAHSPLEEERQRGFRGLDNLRDGHLLRLGLGLGLWALHFAPPPP